MSDNSIETVPKDSKNDSERSGAAGCYVDALEEAESGLTALLDAARDENDEALVDLVYGQLQTLDMWAEHRGIREST